MNEELAQESSPEAQRWNRLILNSAEPFVKPDVVGEYLGIDPSTVVRFAKAGLLPGHPLRISGCRMHWRFLISEIRDAMLARMPASTAECKPKDCQRMDLFRHKRKAS
jgi:hypothetical protein